MTQRKKTGRYGVEGFMLQVTTEPGPFKVQAAKKQKHIKLQ